MFEEMVEKVREAVENASSIMGRRGGKKPKSKTETLENQARAAIRAYYRSEIGKEPVIDVQIVWVG